MEMAMITVTPFTFISKAARESSFAHFISAGI